MEFAAGGLTASERALLEGHLGACEVCRVEAVRLQVSMSQAGGEVDAPASVPLDAVLRDIRAKEEDLWETGPQIGEIKGRAARGLEPFLGNAAAARILRETSEGGEDLLSKVEPVLRLFLGGRAAGKLTDRIVETAVVRP